MLGLRSESDKLLYVDTARFIATVVVVVYHAAGYSTLVSVPDIRAVVDMFFLISGYAIAMFYGDRVRSGYPAFLLNRFARIAPLHWLTFLAMAGMALVGDKLSYGGTAFSVSCALPNILALHATGICPTNSFNGPSWSISAEVGMYACSPFVMAASRRVRSVLLFVAACLLVTIAVDWTAWTSDGGLLRAFPSFLLGATCYRCRRVLADLPVDGRHVLLAALAFCLAVCLGAPSPMPVACAYMVGVTAIIADLRGRQAKWASNLAPLAQLSYPIYMIHVPLLTALASASSLRATGLLNHQNAMVWASVALTLPAAWFLHVYFERPSRSFIRNITVVWHRRRSEVAGLIKL